MLESNLLIPTWKMHLKVLSSVFTRIFVSATALNTIISTKNSHIGIRIINFSNFSIDIPVGKISLETTRE